MADKIDDGGFAFPWKLLIPGGSFNPSRERIVPENEVDVEISTGMSLRDYFAARALTGMLGASVPKAYFSMSKDQFAKEAYWFSDEMIRARKAGA